MAVSGGRAASPPANAVTGAAPLGASGARQAAEVWWFDITEHDPSAADLAGLDVRETARAAAFVFPADRHRYQVAHVMLRRVLAGHLDTEPGSLVFGRDPCPTCGRPSGKPVLARPRPALSFSLAHSGNAVAIAVASQPVGVDVERNATGCICSLATAMNPDDAAIVAGLPEPDRHEAIIRWWVRAEAVLKCAGTGIGHGMDAFAVLGPADAGSWAETAGCSFAPLSAPAGYQAAIAVTGPRQPVRYRWETSRR
jgi:4'-phosphopantetheinyl transferase